MNQEKSCLKQGAKVFLGSILGIVVLVLSIFFLKLVLFPFFIAEKGINTAEGVVDKTLNAQSAYFNYENFHNMYTSAKQQKENIKNAETSINKLKTTYGEDARDWPKDVRAEFNTKQQNIDDFKMMYQKIVADYNADSKKLTRNLFKDKNLPYELPSDYTKLD